ncbi:hypothetical protein [Actinomadura parmotrematis]|uniref:Uncharacterized protein n=1 Tax=Actinomadura parmotrematis TaxID=2864039 RepID=A0ABS7FRX4_9ACTN|nr:hypothetical protein [Actinomadura parmotrematis]MBW8483164.1 hypothetical protein [Actinomadura parmotrematis]
MNASRYWRMARADPGWFAHRVREEAEARAADARRRVRRETDAAVRAALARTGAARAVAAGPAVPAGYFAVLDGCTLNVQAELPAGGADRAEVLFTRRGHELRAPAVVGPGDQVSATVRLGGAAGGVPLGRGRWRVSLALSGPAGVRRVALLGGAMPAGRAGPTVDVPPCPVSGARYVPEASPSGLSSLHVTAPEPAAEVARLHLSLARAEIDVRLVGAAAGTVRMAFQARGSGAVHTVTTAPVQGPGGVVFRARVPLAAMARDSGPGERVWTAVADVPGHGRLRVGRRLHDVRDPRRTLRVAQRTLAAAPGLLLRVRPYYTGGGDLALACTPRPPSPKDPT